MESESNIPEQVLKIYSQDMATRLEGVVAIRRLLSVEEDPPINEVISSGVVPALLELMKPYHDEQLQYESCWAVTNICSGTLEHVQYIVSLGGLDLIMDLLNSNDAEIAEQAIWALGNIIGDSIKHRNLCLEKDVMNRIVSIFNKFPDNQNLKENCVWALSNFLTDPPTCGWDKISNGVAVLKNMLAMDNEIENQSTLADALLSISKCTEVYIQEIIDFGFVPDLIRYLQNFDKQEIIHPVLSALDNIISGSASQTETVLSFKEFVPRLFQLLTYKMTQIRIDACQIICKVMLSSQEHYGLILDNTNWYKSLQKVIQTDFAPLLNSEEDNSLIRQLEALSIYQNESIDKLDKTDENKQKMERE